MPHVMKNEEEAAAFWKGIIRAAQAEPLETSDIQGASGFRHKVEAVGLDKGRHRLIIVSSENNARAAAFAQADLQSVFKSVQVIAVRRLIPKNYQFEDREDKECSSTLQGKGLGESAMVDLSLEELKSGLCVISVEEFLPDEIKAISGAADLEEIQGILRRCNILQYFFPAPDYLALGLIESGRMRFLPQLIDQLVRMPDLGHPFGRTELIPTLYSFTQMVKELQNLDLVKEGEHGLEITEEGLKARFTVRNVSSKVISGLRNTLVV
jgi:hypothetical protein